MKQVYIGKVVDVIEIPGAEKIESLEVVCGPGGKWRGCAQKGEFKKDDLCTVFLQDSLLPQIEEFKFMNVKDLDKDECLVCTKVTFGYSYKDCIYLNIPIQDIVKAIESWQIDNVKEVVYNALQFKIY